MKKIKIVFILLTFIMFSLAIVSNAMELTNPETELEEPIESTQPVEPEGGTYAVLNTHSIEVYEGRTYKLEVDTDYSEEIKWESSNEEIASVENGLVTAISKGTTTITVICGDFTDSCEVIVNEVSLEILSNKSIAIYTKGTHEIEATYSLGNDLITYTSENASIAKVSSTGKITGVSAGETTITVSAENCEDQYVTIYVVDKELSKPVVSSSRTASSINITWNKVSGASKYILYRKVGDGSWTKVATTTSRKYTDKKIAYGKKYYYRVKAIGTLHGLDRVSAYSSSVREVTTTIYKPETITVKSASYNRIKISWTKVVPAKGYEIYRATSKNGKYKKIATITDASTLTYTDKKLITGKTYYYKIRAIYGSAKSGYTTIKAAKPTLATPEMKDFANVTKNTIKVRWNPVSGASGYVIYRRASTSKSWERVGTVKGGSTTTYTDKTTGKYYYSVKAYRTVNGKKVYGKISNSVRLSALKTTSVSAAQDGEEIRNVVSWNKVKNATKYQVYKKVGKNGAWEQVATTTAIVYKADVKHGVKTYWKVRPIYQSNGVKSYGAFSNESVCIASYEPQYSVYMTDDYDPQAYSIGMIFTNNGVGKVRIYSDDSLYLDADYSSFDRLLYLVETETGNFYPIDYIDINPGESKIIMFSVYDLDYTWYDSKGKLYYKFRYDGVTYIGCSCADYGTIYWKK